MRKAILATFTISMFVGGCGQATQPIKKHSEPSNSVSVHNPELPSWLSISNSDINSILIQGWGPGADGSFVKYPASGTSSRLINTLIGGLSNDKAIKPHEVPSSDGGGEWLELKMQNGTSISLATFPNEPTPSQFVVTLDSPSGKPEKTTMISDVYGKVSSVFNEIAIEKLVRPKTH